MTAIAGQFACEECGDDVATVWAFDQALCGACAELLTALAKVHAAEDPATGPR